MGTITKLYYFAWYSDRELTYAIGFFDTEGKAAAAVKEHVGKQDRQDHQAWGIASGLINCAIPYPEKWKPAEYWLPERRIA